jgi:hypothetical protein
VLFGDIGVLDEQLKPSSASASKDEGPGSVELLMEDAREVMNQFDPDITVMPSEIKPSQTNWSVKYNPLWEQVSAVYISLLKVPGNNDKCCEGQLTTLRRSESQCVESIPGTLRILHVKIPNIMPTCTQYYVSFEQRAEMARTIFQLILDTEAPFIVIGNLGFQLASLATFLACFQEETNVNLLEQIHVLDVGTQDCVCLFKYEEGQNAYTCTVNIEGNLAVPYCLCIEILWSSGSAPVEGRRRKKVTLTSRHCRYLNLFAKSETDEELRGKIGTCLLRPVVTSRNAGATGVIDLHETLMVVNQGFTLLRAARAQARVTEDGKSLSQEEFKIAHDWLQKEFETNHLSNEGLKERMKDPNLQGREKKKVRNDLRSFFKTWKRQLLGNQSFLMAVLRHGYFEPGQQQELLVAILQEQDMNKIEMITPQQREEYKMKAREARYALKMARKLDALRRNPNSIFSVEDQNLLKDFDNGILERNVRAANKDFNHGIGSHNLTIAEAASYRMLHGPLDEYHGRKRTYEALRLNY